MDPQEMLYKMLPAWEGTGNASLLLHIIDQRVKAALQSQDTHAMFATFFAEYFANREAEVKSDLPKIGGVVRLPSMPMVDAPAYKVMITARNGIELFTETVADGLSREDAESLADEVASEADIQIAVSPSGVAPYPRSLGLEDSDSTRYFRMVEWLAALIEFGAVAVDMNAVRRFLVEEGRLDA